MKFDVTKRPAGDNVKTLIIQEERTAYNVDEQQCIAFESLTFSQLQMLNVNMYVASQEYSRCLVKILGRVPTAIEQLRIKDMFSRCSSISMEIRDDVSAKEVATLLSEVLDESVVRYLTVKGKKVGDAR